MAAAPTDEEQRIIHVEIDVRGKFSPFNFPSLTEVIRAIEVDFNADLTKVVKARRGPLLGLYVIEAEDYTNYVGKVVRLRNEELPITPRYFTKRASNKKDGTLVTLYDAYDRKSQSIPGTSFDQYFMETEGVTILKQTTPQRHKDTRVLNGNRFVVLSFDPTKIDLGESISIGGTNFNIRYHGMHRYCYLCKDRHNQNCPAKAKFEKMQQDRRDKINMKIYSDSSLRNVNQLALTANVACTSGAGIGQIVNSIKEDDEVQKKIIIYAGINEIKHTDDLHQYVYSVEKAAEKLHGLALKRDITVLMPTAPQETVEEKSKYRYLKEKLVGVPSINVHEIPTQIPYMDRHPTEEGTKTIIGSLEEKVGLPLILEKGEVFTDRRYAFVQSCYKVGCRGCEYREYTPALCDTCLEHAKGVDITRFMEIIKEVFTQEFPDEPDVEMTEIMKRDLPVEDRVDSHAKKVKEQDGGQE